MIKVLFICLGNICRSPMAQFVFKDLVEQNNLTDKFYINSMATSTEAVGDDIYPNTQAVLTKHNIPFNRHIATQIRKEDYHNYDYILCMEEKNIRHLQYIIESDPDNKVYRLLDFSPNPKDISDPWHHRNFDKTYIEITMGCKHFLEYLKNNRII